MKKAILVLALLVAAVATAEAQARQQPASQRDLVPPDCRLGRAPVNTKRVPAPGEQRFIAPKGAIVHMEFRTPGQQRLTDVRCKFAEDTESYAMSPSRAWDVPSGNDFTPEGWAIVYKFPEVRGLDGRPGERGEPGLKGEPGRDGLNCWDINGNGDADAAEDIDNNGVLNARDCRGEQGAPGANGVTEVRYIDDVDDGPGTLGFTGSINPFSSVPISGLVGKLTGRDVCEVNGLTWTVGLAVRGEPEASGRRNEFWRFAFAGTTINEGSFTHFICNECNKELRVVAKDMRVWGGEVEAVFYLTDWERVRLVFSPYVNVGKVVGTATRYEILANGTAVPTNVGARELFGNDWYGRGGVMAGIGKHNARVAWGAGATIDNMGVGAKVTVAFWP